MSWRVTYWKNSTTIGVMCVNPGVDEIPTLYNSITSTMIMSPISQLLIIFFGLIETYIKYDNLCDIKNKYTMYQVQD
jgi:hypothetical protein